jgi:diadenosine tetraphosphate (Ap4A) HIT family hydrolase
MIDQTVGKPGREIPEVNCLSCAIVGGLIVPVGGTILETTHFHAHQDYAYPIPGFVILAAKRHVSCLDELTPEEAREYGLTLQRLRRAQRDALGIEIVYYFNNEDTRHHFHTWMLPRHEWMDGFGRYVESVRPIVQYAGEQLAGPEQIEQVRYSVEQLRQALQKPDS